MNRIVRIWWRGFFGGIIGGAATSGCSFLGMSAAHSAGFDVPVLNFKALGIILLSGAVSSGLAYLKQSPLPPDEMDTKPVSPGTIASVLFFLAFSVAALALLTGCARLSYSVTKPDGTKTTASATSLLSSTAIKGFNADSSTEKTRTGLKFSSTDTDPQLEQLGALIGAAVKASAKP